MQDTIIRIILGILGGAFLLAGIAGIFMPVIPGVIFLVLAAACFSKSSTKLHSLIFDNKAMKPIMQSYKKTHALPMKFKLSIVLGIWIIVALQFITTENLLIKSSMVLSAVCASVYIISIKTLKQVHHKIKKFSKSI
jgi:uncharacterized protein